VAIRALLLDFDGTLADSLPAMRRVYERFVADLSGTPTAAEFDALNGPPLAEVVRRLCATHQNRLHAGEDLERYEALIADELAQIDPAAGARDLLDYARSRGILCAIVTSSRRALVQSWLDAAGLRVDLIICGEDVAEGKPSPAPYRMALQQLGAGAEEALAIEDSAAGVESATAAGIRTLHLSLAATAGVNSIASLDEALAYLDDKTWAA
jgi:HAD superfamily hydrolase (TIGR01509 family)